MNSKNWILITGGTGFIGLALVKRLIALGYSVRIITRNANFDRSLKNLFSETSNSRVDIFIGEIHTSSSIKQAFRNVDYVFHVAAMVHSDLPYASFETANVLATKNICELCLEFKVKRLLYISTCDVFGIPGKNVVFNESSPFKYWLESYPDTKIKATKLVKDFQKEGIKSTIIYPGWVYGPGDKAFIPSILKQLQSGFMPIWDGGKNKLCLVYIDDLVDAIIIAFNNEKSVNEDFLILDDSSRINLEDVCVMLGSLFNTKCRIIHLPYRIAYVMAWASQKLVKMRLFKEPIMLTSDVKSLGHNFNFSTKKAKSVLNWSVKTEFESGLLKWKSWFEANMM